MVNQRQAAKEETKGLIKFLVLKIYLSSYFFFRLQFPVRYSQRMKGITMTTCMMKRQLSRSSLLAGIFMIHPGMEAPRVTEMSKTNHANLLPDFQSKILVYYPALSLCKGEVLFFFELEELSDVHAESCPYNHFFLNSLFMVFFVEYFFYILLSLVVLFFSRLVLVFFLNDWLRLKEPMFLTYYF